jgi:DNA ligase-1
MKIEGEPDFKVWIFDYVDSNSNDILPYYLRILNMPAFSVPFQYEVLSGTTIKTQEELLHYEEICLSAGYEGVILRDPMGTYKFGRSTTSENILLKVKRFIDDEAVIIDVLEQMSNQNPEEKDAFGHVKRSQSIEGMVPTNTAGTLVVRGSNGIIFDMGSGLNDALRREIWDNKDEYIGKLVKYKYFPQGIKDKPRHPVFLGFRNEDDL